jgi:hypothetical protein
MAVNDSTIVALPSDSGNVTITTSATGTDYVAFADRPAKAVAISNNSGTSLSIRQDGSDFILPTASIFKFDGIEDASQLSVKRTDESDTPVTASARWER